MTNEKKIQAIFGHQKMPSYEVFFSAYKTLNTTCTLKLHFCKKEMSISYKCFLGKEIVFSNKTYFHNPYLY